MLEDAPRTLAYQKAILNNKDFFHGKTVMDIGAGTGKSHQIIRLESKRNNNDINRMFVTLRGYHRLKLRAIGANEESCCKMN